MGNASKAVTAPQMTVAKPQQQVTNTLLEDGGKKSELADKITMMNDGMMIIKETHIQSAGTASPKTDSVSEGQAATKIQAVYRGIVARGEAEDLREAARKAKEAENDIAPAVSGLAAMEELAPYGVTHSP